MGSAFSRPKVTRKSIIAHKNFLRIYRMQLREMLPNDAFLNAARVWEHFSPAQRMQYAQMSCVTSDLIMDMPPKAAKKGAKKAVARKMATKNKVKKSIKAKRTPKRQLCEEMPLSNGFLNFLDED